jgi:hypothetical protein
MNQLAALLRDFAQGASNNAASTVTAPVDALAWLLRKGGVPIPENPVGGSDWARQKGLTAEPQNKLAGLLGDAAGMAVPLAAVTKAPQIARGLLQMGDNLAAPTLLNKESGMIRSPFGRIPETHNEADLLANMLEKSGRNSGYSVVRNDSAVSPSKYVSFSKPIEDNAEKTLQVRLSNHADKYPELANGIRTSVDPITETTFEQAVNWLAREGFPTSLSTRYKNIPSHAEHALSQQTIREIPEQRLAQLQAAWLNKPKSTRGAYPTLEDAIRIYGGNTLP